MKGRNGIRKLTAFLSIVTGSMAFLLLVTGIDLSLGLGIWLCFASLALLTLWTGDRVTEILRDTKEDSE